MTKTAGIGAVIGIAVVVLGRLIGSTPADNNTLGYWFGVALFGAIVGVMVAKFARNR